jgi:hypothetical protein
LPTIALTPRGSRLNTPNDFVKDSGTVLYYENIDAITRAGNKSEIIKIILEF